MEVESQGAMPQDAGEFKVPEVPAEVTDGTLARQEAAGDPLKEAAIQRKEEIKSTFPEVPSFVTDGTLKRQEAVEDWEDGAPQLDQRMAADLAEQERWDNFKHDKPIDSGEKQV